jgi:hypothetical protein
VYSRGSTEWRPYGTGLPHVTVSDLEFTRFTTGNTQFGCLLAATWGRGIWQACGYVPPGTAPRRLTAISHYSRAVPIFWFEPDLGNPPGDPPDYYEITRTSASEGRKVLARRTVPYFRDDSAKDNTPYAYEVTAHFPDRPSVSAGAVAQALWGRPRTDSEITILPAAPPTIDGIVGILNSSEWADAQRVVITVTDEPNVQPLMPVQAWVKYDANNLYVAVIDENISPPPTPPTLPPRLYDVMTVYVDWNGNREWPDRASEEGSYHGSAFRRGGQAQHSRIAYTGSWPRDVAGVVAPTTMDYQYHFLSTGAHHEMRIPIPQTAATCGAARCVGFALQTGGAVQAGDLLADLRTGMWPFGMKSSVANAVVNLSFVPFAFGNLRLAADPTGDSALTCEDLEIVRASLGKRSGQAGFDPRADIDGDGVVSVRDLALVAQRLPANQPCN